MPEVSLYEEGAPLEAKPPCLAWPKFFNAEASTSHVIFLALREALRIIEPYELIVEWLEGVAVLKVGFRL